MKTFCTNIVKAQVWVGGRLHQTILLCALLVILALGACSDTMPTRTPTNQPTPMLFQVVKDTDISNTVLGKIEVEYPLRMISGSSDLAIVQIYIPDQFVSIEPVTIERVDIPPDVPLVIGILGLHQATILVRDMMRVELSAPGLEITSLHPSVQPVNTRDANKATVWAWTIKAPDTLGRQVLVVSVYLGKDVVPSWTGSITVKVLETMSAPTPIPSLTKVRDQLIDNSTKILIAVLTALIGLAVPIYKVYQDNKKRTTKN